MSDGSEPTVAHDDSAHPEPGAADSVTTASPAEPATGAATDADATPAPEAPQDPVERALAPVSEAMAQARAAGSVPGDTPAVPTDDEVAALEHAHEVLRSTLDRVDRGG